jgi:hypothetical protein
MDKAKLAQKIRETYNEFVTNEGVEPDYLECEICFCDTNEDETFESKIALTCDSTEFDEEIFFFCNSIEDAISFVDDGVEDFRIVDFYSFGCYFP